MNKIGCFAPYGHYHLDIHGFVKPCCYWHADVGHKRKLYEFDNLESIGKELTDYMSDDIMDLGCVKCVQYEAKNVPSLRQKLNRNITWEDKRHLPKDLEVSLDSICNFACVMCDKSRSSKWRSLGKNIKNLPKDKNISDENHFDTVERLLINSDLTELIEVKMLGGEPFYSKNFPTFIDILDDKTDITKVVLTITTNSSVFPTDKLLKKLLRFKRLQVNSSIDGVGDTAEVVRYGTKWKDVEKNLLAWRDLVINDKEKVALAISPTFHIFNMEHEKRLRVWWLQNFRNVFNATGSIAYTLATEPYLCIQNLNKKFRRQFDPPVYDVKRWKTKPKFFSTWNQYSEVPYEIIYNYIENYSNMVGIDMAETIPLTMEQLRRQQSAIIE